MQVIKLKNTPYAANAYLVDRAILVDVGMDAEAVISELEKYIQLEELEIIILTHCHHDHSGGAGEVASACDASIAIHREDAPLLGNPHTTVSSLFGEDAPPLEPDILLRGGEMIKGLEVIHTPGHTPGSICLYDRDSGSLFSGDTVFQDGGFGRTDLYGGSMKHLISSIRKLSSLKVSAMYPGHGDVVKERAYEHIDMSLKMANQYSVWE